jgi:transglutaminase-like putative cysteine protease
MKEYTVLYESFNVYEEKVNDAVFDFRVLPCNDNSQIVSEYSIKNSAGESPFTFKNLFGFDVKRVRTNGGFKEFSFSLKAVVQKNHVDLNYRSFLTKENEMEMLHSNDFFIDHHLFLQKSHYTTIQPENYNLVLSHDRYESLFDYLISLNRYVSKMLTYDTKSTHVKTTANEALKVKSGVCQDYTHIFISMCRHNNIPARYISGYLNQGMDFLGNSLMHAWAEAFVPEVGWIAFDPTNNLLVDENYIKVSHGADYSDCSPIKGVLKTKGDNQTTYSVKVTSQQSQQQQ